MAPKNRQNMEEVPRFLKHNLLKITDPLTDLPFSMHQTALRNFLNIMRCMGDKPNPVIQDKELPILTTAKSSPELCDEVYCQVMKQLTENPSADSTTKGWTLLLALCKEVPPSDELFEFVRFFVQKMANSRKGEEDEEENLFPRGCRMSTAVQAAMRRKNYHQNRNFSKIKQCDLAQECLQALEESLGSDAEEDY